MKTLKILTIGNITQDITFNTDQGILVKNSKDITRQQLLAFELGAKVKIDSADFDFGGGAANSAVNFVKQNCQVSVLSCVGQEKRGEEIIKNLKNLGIKTNLIQQNDEVASPLSIILNATNLQDEHTIYTYRGANEKLKINLEELREMKFDVIYLSSISGKQAQSNLVNVFRYGLSKSKQIKIAWNPGGEQIKKGLSGLKTYLKATDILMLNKDEAIEVCLQKEVVSNVAENNSKKLISPRDLLRKIAEVCSGTVVITDGANGAYAYKNKQIYFEPALKVKTRDTTGVGDAFNSTLTWLLTKGIDLPKALRLASFQAASVLQKVGAQKGLIKLKI